jgi:hypothetical protein
VLIEVWTFGRGWGEGGNGERGEGRDLGRDREILGMWRYGDEAWERAGGSSACISRFEREGGSDLGEEFGYAAAEVVF